MNESNRGVGYYAIDPVIQRIAAKDAAPAEWRRWAAPSNGDE